MNSNHNLNKWDVKRFAHSFLLKTLNLKQLTAFTTLEVLLDIVLLSAVKNSSPEQTCKQSQFSPCGKTIREHLKNQLGSVDIVEKKLNSSLSKLLPKTFKKKPIPIAVDLFEVPYYGKKQDDSQFIRRIKRKNGASRCHAYATAYAIKKGKRYTLAITFVLKSDKMIDVLKRLNKQLTLLSIKPEYFLLDRGFYCVEVIKWLKRFKKAFIMPAIIRGKPSKDGKDATGTYIFKEMKYSAWKTYTITSPKAGQVEVDIGVYSSKKSGKRKTYVYTCNLMKNKTLIWVKETYRKRFGIEVSHRQRNEMGIKSCTKNACIKYFYVGIGFILRNIWVFLHENILYEKRRGTGGKRLQIGLLTLEHLKCWLRSVLEEEYGFVEQIDVEPFELNKLLNLNFT